MRAFARRLVGDPEAAEDLVHEVFVSLPRAIRRYREQSSLRTFLISIAVNHARHFVRAGIPAVCFGPRGERIHGIDERVSLRSVTESAQVLGLFIRDWCGLA